MEVLLLGHKGMLGHMVIKYLQSKNVFVHTIENRWPLNKQEIKAFKGDYIINCIGAIPQKTNEFSINWELPIWLDQNAPCPVIHPGTDCEMDDDEYGISKRKAVEYILEFGSKTKILKTSIMGPELNTKSSFLEWFFSEKNSVYGYTEAIVSCNTTLEWSKHCLDLLLNWDKYPIMNILEGEPLSKYDILLHIKDVFNINTTVIPKKLGKNKTLKGEIKTLDFVNQLKELKKYYYD